MSPFPFLVRHSKWQKELLTKLKSADRYKSLFDRIDDLANTYFTDLTDKAIWVY